MTVNSSALQAVEWCNPGTSCYGFCRSIAIIASGDGRQKGVCVCVRESERAAVRAHLTVSCTCVHKLRENGLSCLTFTPPPPPPTLSCSICGLTSRTRFAGSSTPRRVTDRLHGDAPQSTPELAMQSCDL